ncbi:MULTISPECIES: recombinase family protein [Mesorhizobium]|uniref:Resolvase/invertase-type recombinase catalytic domain-containing protein n=4 Tax=Mesorhizobium TaxID=68287 RepID=A0A2P9AU18_9HYPH|nr:MULTISPECIES: recombinase family protein [Mesorhizobium]CAH2399123.1 Resolvase/invertase-type recombinase catalytic domain-containing protein [Mesorhizobium escarrei]SJM34663.1 hypothetical protein BQ8482_490002 [Mesorhizobium delmotii]
MQDDASLDTTTRTGKLVFSILWIAEFETALRKERQMEGIAKAKAKAEAKGEPWKTGRPVVLDHDLIRPSGCPLGRLPRWPDVHLRRSRRFSLRRREGHYPHH